MIGTVLKIVQVIFGLVLIANVVWLGFFAWTAWGTGQIMMASVAGAGAVGWVLAVIFWGDWRARKWLESRGMNPEEV